MSFGPATWRAFDAETGNALFNITNVPTGTKVLGPQGEVLIYTITNAGTSSNPQYYLARWNSSRLWTGQYSGASTTPSIVPPITDGRNTLLYDWNISLSSLTRKVTSLSRIRRDRRSDQKTRKRQYRKQSRRRLASPNQKLGCPGANPLGRV
jgi:hypothetical protein